jgi:hypothetical protein
VTGTLGGVRWTLPVVVAGLVFVLTGCSPGRWPMVAVQLVDGAPAAVIATCPVDELSVLQVSEVSDADMREWPVWRAQGARPLADGETVPLFTPPQGWRADVSQLSELRPLAGGPAVGRRGARPRGRSRTRR